LHEFEIDSGDRGSGSMLNRQSEIVSVSAQIEVGVAPGVEL